MPTPRPLSPHLQVYRWQWTMVLSILHRVTGISLGLGTVLLAWWLLAAASGPGAFAVARAFIGSIPGRLVLLSFTFALFFHLANGVRHLFWDFGMGLERNTARRSGWIAFLAAIVLTVVAWELGYLMRDGAAL